MSDDHFKQFNDKLAGKVALVTGGAGFIGSHIATRMHGCGATVRVLDDLSGGYPQNLPEGVELIHASIIEQDALARACEGVDYVFHHAAMVSVPESVAKPDQCVRVNVSGTERVLDAAKRGGARRVMFAASAAASGDTPALPSSESHTPDCYSPYAASKVSGEMLLSVYARNFDLSTVSLRYFNIFGPKQDPTSAYAAVISAFANRLLAGTQPSIFGDGKQTRDFTYIDNVVLANLLAATSDRDLRGEVITIGTGTQSSLRDVLEAMNRVTKVPGGPEFKDPRAGDVRDSVADISRARELLGYEPIVDLTEGLERTMVWMRDNVHPPTVTV